MASSGAAAPEVIRKRFSAGTSLHKENSCLKRFVQKMAMSGTCQKQG